MARVIKAGREAIIPAAVMDARAKAAEIVAAAEHQKTQELADARSRGFDAGRAEGLASASEILGKAERAASARLAAAQADVSRLAVHVARKILGRELTLRPSTIADITREALKEVGDRTHIRLRVHPDDVAALDQSRPMLAGALRSDAAFRLEADDRISRGGCVIDTEVGAIDARLEVQLEAIERVLLGGISR